MHTINNDLQVTRDYKRKEIVPRKQVKKLTMTMDKRSQRTRPRIAKWTNQEPTSLLVQADKQLLPSKVKLL